MTRRSLLAEALRARLLSDPSAGTPNAATLKMSDEIARLELSSADVEPVLATAAKTGSTPECVTRLLDEAGVTIDWGAGRPTLMQGGFAPWTWLVDDFDPDILLCCHLVTHLRGTRHKAPSLDTLPLGAWGYFVGSACTDLERLLSAGFADMHIHLGGARQPADVWRRLVTGTLGVDDALRRTPPHMLRPPKPPGKLLDRLRDMLAFRHAHIAHDDGDNPASFLAHERRWCLRLASVMVDNARQKQDRKEKENYTNRETESETQKAAFLRDAERYFWIRHHLWRLLRQPQEGTSPGLHDFSRVWFKAVPRDVSVRKRRSKSWAAVAVEHRAPFLMLLHPGVERLELRLSPLGAAAAYSRFFKAWEELELDVFARTTTNPKVSFSIHLQRNAGGGKDPLALLDKFDRETAGLHLFRQPLRDHAVAASDGEYAKHAAHVVRLVRIDLASVEREGPARYAAPFFRLLRGDGDALGALKNGRVRPGRMRNWTDLHARDFACPEFGMPRLGASCHAGEDFGALVVGLKEIADAIDGMPLGTGDSIGHGLAMGWDPAAFEERMGWASNVAAGELLDALVWLRLELGDDCPADPNRKEISKVERWIHVRLNDIYGPGRAAELLRGRRGLERYRRASLFYPLELPSGGDDRHVDELVWSRYENPQARNRFADMLPWSACDERSLDPAVLAWLQARLRRRCADDGIVVELHPSSNLRISGLRNLEDGPTLRLLLADEKFRKAIGTDDPGVFATDVASEFALVFETLLGAGMSREQARALLDQCRLDALEEIRWPGPVASMTR